MTKQELIKELAISLEISQVKANDIFSLFLEEVILTLEEGEQVSHLGFGSFKAEVIPGRVRFNPSTKEEMLYPTSRKLRFRPSDKLKADLNGESDDNP